MNWYKLDFDQCPDCGDDLEVLQNNDPEYYGYLDGSEVRCVNCDAKLYMTVDEDEACYVNWVEDTE